MSVLNLIHKLKTLSLNHPLVQQSTAGGIQDFSSKSDVRYPYCNFDVIKYRIRGGSKEYTVRVYVCDRNETYNAYSKGERILDDLLHHLQLNVEDYTATFFKNDFQDEVDGVYTDVIISEPLMTLCYSEEDETGGRFILEDKTGYIVTEEGDYVKSESSKLSEVEEESLPIDPVEE